MQNIDFEDWIDRWQRTLESVGQIALHDDCRLEIKSPATLQEVNAVEKELGSSLPESLKRVLCNFSAGVDFFWFLREFTYPAPFEFVNHGICHWDLRALTQLELSRRRWLSLFTPEEMLNPSLDLFRDKLVFISVGNGDSIAIDLTEGSDGPVLYLACHLDDEEGHGSLLGENFIDFIARWTQIGCVGAEISQMINFTDDPTSYLQPESAFAIHWRETLGI